MALIRFQELHKAFGKNEVYAGVTLEVNQGETLVLIGGSGTGKSVLLKMLIGLLRPDSGEIWFDGERIDQLNERQFLPIRRRIAMLFQGGALFDSMDVQSNIAYGLREQTEMNEDEIAARVKEVLGWVGLSGREAIRPAELSGGMKKRVALARAIALHPEVILYDEPTTGLDPLNTKRISKLIVELKQKLGATSIVVTHDMDSAFMVADRLAMLHDKKVVATGTTQELKTSRDPVVHAFVHAMRSEAPEAKKRG